MRRLRRISIEVVHRQVSLSIAGPIGATSEACSNVTARDKDEAQESLIPPPECPVCASPWFVLPTGGGEDPAIVQRALVKHAIHTQLSPGGELFVCGRSFELHIGGSNAHP